MTIIDVEISPKIRKGEAGTIVLSIPETEGIKILKIEVPRGVLSPSGNSITLAPNVTHVDIPILVTKDASEEVMVKFSLSERKTERKSRLIEGSKDYLLKISE